MIGRSRFARRRSPILCACPTTPRLLTVAVTSRALFDLEESHALYEREGVKAYSDYQRHHEDDVLAPGIAYPVVRKLLALNAGAPPDAPRVEVILLSRNSADTGLRIFNSIQHYGLGIVRATFTAGEPTWPYVKPFGTDLFLSANPESVRRSLEHGIAAATILPAGAPQQRHEHQLRIAFDGDAVIFGDEGERISREQGVEAFGRHEQARAREPLSGGPFRNFLAALHQLQQVFPADERSPIRTALVTAFGPRPRAGDPDIEGVGRAPGRSAVPRRTPQRAVPGSLRCRHLLR